MSRLPDTRGRGWDAPAATAPASMGPAGSVRGWVERWWAGESVAFGGLLSLMGFPLELAFRTASGFWNRLYDSGALPLQRSPVPVLSVGNLTVGGSGKTPFSAWLTGELLRRGEKPALVSRGYGGDEILLHRRWNPRIPVLHEEDRAYGAWKAARKGASVVVLDDGFQHRRLRRELDVVLVAARTPRRVRLLPRGPFREPLAALKRAGVVVLTQKGRDDETAETEMRLEPYLREPPVKVCFHGGSWSDLTGRPSTPPPGAYLGVAGVGDPDGFRRVLLETLGREGEILVFPDHHPYGWQDVERIRERARGRTVITTEKDAVKLSAFQEDLPELRVLGLETEVIAGKERLWRHVEAVLSRRRGES